MVVLSRKLPDEEQAIRKAISEIDTLGDQVSWTVELFAVVVHRPRTVSAPPPLPPLAGADGKTVAKSCVNAPKGLGALHD